MTAGSVSRPKWEGEVVAANSAHVAQADQISAAEPRREPSKVVLCDWLPLGKVYVINLDALNDQLDSMEWKP